MMIPPLLAFAIFMVTLVAATAYALVRGGAPERWAAALQIAAWIVTVFLTPHTNEAFERVQVGVFVTDVILLAGLTWLALRANRYWTLWIASFQLVAVLLHLLRIMDPDMLRTVYGIVLTFWAYPMLLLMMIGTRRHRIRLASFGTDISWTSFSPPSKATQRRPR